MRLFYKFLVLVFIISLSVEFIARLIGIADIPIRTVNNVTGYVPEKSQSGSILGNDWVINQMGMISSADFFTTESEVLLIGDSIVFGGARLRQKERLGERLDAMLDGQNVYAIADGSWGFKNSLNWLESNIDRVRNVETVLFILNSGDFGTPSSWRCESIHPTQKPGSHAYFAMRKYLAPICVDAALEGNRVRDFNSTQKFLALSDQLTNTNFIIFLYSTKDEYRKRVSLRDLLEIDGTDEAKIIELINYPEQWSDKYYIDSIHPSKQGVIKLASILAREIKSK